MPRGAASEKGLAMATPLDEVQLAAALEKLPGWELRDGKLARVYRFKDFGDAFAFMCACALRIHALDHHPEWSNVYSTVKVELVTHDAKGITVRDVELASVMERIAKRFESA
jgi:4a-hydroxytetrahydrobiopterin dehydratase